MNEPTANHHGSSPAEAPEHPAYNHAEPPMPTSPDTSPSTSTATATHDHPDQSPPGQQALNRDIQQPTGQNTGQDTDENIPTAPATPPQKPHHTRRHFLAALPAFGAIGLGLGFARMLHRLHQGDFDPHAINIPQTGRAVPDFTALPPLPGLPNIPGLSRSDFLGLKQPVLLLAWASWCLPCVEEIPFLHALATHLEAGQNNGTAPLALWGLCYKDQPAPALRFLARAGQPFSRVGMDMTGRSAMDWGISGVPESFLILPASSASDTQGEPRIIWHGTGSLTMEDYQHHIRPHLEAAP